jgi:hypothetical protein
MDWQLLFVGFAIAVAGTFVLVRIWRSLPGTKTGCGGSCGCAKSNAESATPALIKPEQLMLKKPSTHGARPTS